MTLLLHPWPMDPPVQAASTQAASAAPHLGGGRDHKQAFWKNEPISVLSKKRLKWLIINNLRTGRRVVKKRQFEKRTHFWGTFPKDSNGCQKHGARKMKVADRNKSLIRLRSDLDPGQSGLIRLMAKFL
jgi:hypothetical protein